MNLQDREELKQHIEKLINYGGMFEQNDHKTQRWFRSAMNIHLTDLSSRDIIRDYIVVCDDTNNDTESNTFKAEIYYREHKEHNFNKLEVVATRSSTTFYQV